MKASSTDENESQLRRLLSPGIKLILVKGAPGTGKTSLAARLLEFVKSGEYISTRVGLEKLSEQNKSLLPLEKKGSLKETSLESSKPHLQDMRLATNQLVMNAILKAASTNKQLIVLDSWDTMAKEIGSIERLKVEKSIAAIVDASNSRAVFISEEPDLTNSDYLMDAIVNLGYTEVDGRRIREIVWEKLRGQPIFDRKSAFTLADGQFNLISKPDLEPKKPRKFKPIQNSQSHFSTGSKDLDAFLRGGLGRGMYLLLEVGNTVGNNWHRPMYEMIRANFLLNGGSCLVVPAPPTTARMVLDTTIPYVGDDIVRSRLRVVSYTPTTPHPSVVDVSNKSLEEVFNIQAKTVQDLKRQSNNAGTLCILNMDIFESFAGVAKSSMGSYIVRGGSMIREFGDVLVMLAKPGTESIQLISDNCDMHLKLEEVNGSLVMYGKRPPTNPYGIKYDFSEGYPRVILTRIM
jgi:KaiC/GvpD/RAD55 family RecA-like ATPase